MQNIIRGIDLKDTVTVTQLVPSNVQKDGYGEILISKITLFNFSRSTASDGAGTLTCCGGNLVDTVALQSLSQTVALPLTLKAGLLFRKGSDFTLEVPIADDGAGAITCDALVEYHYV